ncbi:MAG: ATP-grasp domain-containing protein [Deltaproteobacteria bacterium]|nr:ATP-grasp domain-containing protein [Deltaproteobacteria bacterium]
MSKKTLLIISGGIEAVPIIKQARDMGLRVVVSDGNPSAPGFEIADERIIASTYDHERTIELAIESNKKNPIHGVMAAAADVPYTVSYVSNGLGLTGIPLESARITTDKLAMKEFFKTHGIPVPWFSNISNEEHLNKLLRETEKNLIVKPVDSRGARGVIRLLKNIDPDWAYNESLKHSPSKRLMVEQWIEGRQISTESIVTEDDVTTPGLSDRNYQYLERFAPFVIEDGGDLPAELSQDEKDAIDRVISNVARCLSVKNWTIKGDIVIGANGPLVIEAALRLSGGYFCSHTIPLSTGSNIVEAAILMALGEKIDIKKYAPCFKQHVCQRFIFPEPGVLTEVKADPRIYNDKNLEMLNIYVKAGDAIPKIVSHPCRAGTIVTTGKTRKEAIDNAQRILSSISIKSDFGG